MMKVFQKVCDKCCKRGEYTHTTGMKAKDMRDIPKMFPEFNGQKMILDDYIEGQRHKNGGILREHLWCYGGRCWGC